MTSSLNRIDEILAFGKPRSLICAIESASGAIALFVGNLIKWMGIKAMDEIGAS
ncbi:MAG: hypothetical protein RMY29_014910 [Nostoc sp. CreGUA01]|nr:hypothetical protein [Nostoc sp. CreGUA01]